MREAGLEDRAKEVAHARERAVVSLDLAQWRKFDVVKLGLAIFRFMAGCLTDYGLSLTSGVIILLVCTLAFVPVYFLFGFSRAANRKTGIVRIIPEKTLVAGAGGDTLTPEAKVERLAPTGWMARLFWAICFASVTAVRSGIGPFNLLELLERVFGWKVMGATGWLRGPANAQAFISFLLSACILYAYFL